MGADALEVVALQVKISCSCCFLHHCRDTSSGDVDIMADKAKRCLFGHRPQGHDAMNPSSQCFYWTEPCGTGRVEDGCSTLPILLIVQKKCDGGCILQSVQWCIVWDYNTMVITKGHILHPKLDGSSSG